VQQHGHSVDKIVSVVSNWEASSAIQAELERNIMNLTVDERHLQEECELWERQTLDHRQKLSSHEQLQDMGCGLKELKLLFSTIREVSVENKIHERLAVNKFFRDIETEYDSKLGYESKLVDLKSEIERLKSEIDKQNKELSVLQEVLKSKDKVARALGDLILFGFDEQQILNLAWALQCEASNKDSLEEDLKMYGSLKKLIEGLNQEF
jgi:Rad3-related DNA helicase